MSDVATCVHERTEPVDVRSHLTGETETVAHVCADCLEQLPAEWGCTDCEWVNTRRMCDPVPTRLLAQPCARHAGT